MAIQENKDAADAKAQADEEEAMEELRKENRDLICANRVCDDEDHEATASATATAEEEDVDPLGEAADASAK